MVLLIQKARTKIYLKTIIGLSFDFYTFLSSYSEGSVYEFSCYSSLSFSFSQKILGIFFLINFGRLVPLTCGMETFTLAAFIQDVNCLFFINRRTLERFQLSKANCAIILEINQTTLNEQISFSENSCNFKDLSCFSQHTGCRPLLLTIILKLSHIFYLNSSNMDAEYLQNFKFLHL